MDVLNEALALYYKPEIFNINQSSQYTSHMHTKTLKDKGITISMDDKGWATDNICIERFWRSAKDNYILKKAVLTSWFKTDLLWVFRGAN